MKCTACKAGDLLPAYLDDLFPCHTCDNCGGNFIQLTDYLRWQQDNENTEFVSDASTPVQAEETSKAMICPKSGRLMTKYRINKDTDHRLDLSPSISAIWIDAGEWQLLKQQGLAGKLNEIFTKHWQRDIHDAKAADVLAAMYERKFGENYEAIKEFREKLNDMEDKSSVVAYLISDDPYEP